MHEMFVLGALATMAVVTSVWLSILMLRRIRSRMAMMPYASDYFLGPMLIINVMTGLLWLLALKDASFTGVDHGQRAFMLFTVVLVLTAVVNIAVEMLSRSEFELKNGLVPKGKSYRGWLVVSHQYIPILNYENSRHPLPWTMHFCHGFRMKDVAVRLSDGRMLTMQLTLSADPREVSPMIFVRCWREKLGRLRGLAKEMREAERSYSRDEIDTAVEEIKRVFSHLPIESRIEVRLPSEVVVTTH